MRLRLHSYGQINIYEENNVLCEGNLTTGAVTDHFYANMMQVAKKVDSTVSYYQQDALGNTRLVTNSFAGVNFSSNYMPFGISYNVTGSETFAYTGKPSDPSTGLMYFGARFYDPSIFRFTMADTVKGSISDPLSLNRYAYARDNPMRIVDPNGHGWFDWIGKAVSNVATTVTGAVSSAASAVTNAWNSIGPVGQGVIVVAAVVAVGVLTLGVGDAVLGAAAGAADVAAGAISTGVETVGTYAAVAGTVAMGGLEELASDAQPITSDPCVFQGAANAALTLSGDVASNLITTGQLPSGQAMTSDIFSGFVGGYAGEYAKDIPSLSSGTSYIASQTIISAGGGVLDSWMSGKGDYADQAGWSTSTSILSSDVYLHWNPQLGDDVGYATTFIGGWI